MIKRYLAPVAVLVLISSLFGLAHVAKLNGIQGLFHSFFSFSHSIAPLFGMVFGFSGSIALILGMMTLKFSGIIAYSYFGLPAFCASLCWATDNRCVRVGIPAVCMALFLVHPIGFAAAPYAFYWLIPIVSALAYTQNRFLTALSSTFVAHAVGSVMHLYFINPMTSSAWLALIPVVALERLVLALGMYVAYIVVASVSHRAVSAFQQNFQQCPTTD